MTWSVVCLRAMVLCVSSCVHCRTRILTKSLDYFSGTQPVHWVEAEELRRELEDMIGDEYRIILTRSYR